MSRRSISPLVLAFYLLLPHLSSVSSASHPLAAEAPPPLLSAQIQSQQMSRALVLLISRQLYVAHIHLRLHVTCNLNQRHPSRAMRWMVFHVNYICSARDTQLAVLTYLQSD